MGPYQHCSCDNGPNGKGICCRFCNSERCHRWSMLCTRLAVLWTRRPGALVSKSYGGSETAKSKRVYGRLTLDGEWFEEYSIYIRSTRQESRTSCKWTKPWLYTSARDLNTRSICYSRLSNWMFCVTPNVTALASVIFWIALVRSNATASLRGLTSASCTFELLQSDQMGRPHWEDWL